MTNLPDPSTSGKALSDRQRDGQTCIDCGADFEPGSRSVPAGFGDRGQLFACAAHDDLAS
jgi:hypothetical protein